jgi:heme o synthase
MKLRIAASVALAALMGYLLRRGAPVQGAATVFALWQPPHFWLHALAHQEDYRNGAVPSWLAVFSKAQMLRILFAWVLALAMALLALPLAVRPSGALLAVVVLDAGCLVAFFARALFMREQPWRYRGLFATLNLAVFLATAATVLLS